MGSQHHMLPRTSLHVFVELRCAVAKVIDTAVTNLWWRPYWQQCDVCSCGCAIVMYFTVLFVVAECCFYLFLVRRLGFLSYFFHFFVDWHLLAFTVSFRTSSEVIFCYLSCTYHCQMIYITCSVMTLNSFLCKDKWFCHVCCFLHLLLTAVCVCLYPAYLACTREIKFVHHVPLSLVLMLPFVCPLRSYVIQDVKFIGTVSRFNIQKLYSWLAAVCVT